MEISINNAKWTIEEVEKDRMTCESTDYTLGLTIYVEQKILLLKNQPNLIRTLKHELAHVWLYEYGHAQSNNRQYHYEEVCNIVAASNDFINEVVEEYIKRKE